MHMFRHHPRFNVILVSCSFLWKSLRRDPEALPLAIPESTGDGLLRRIQRRNPLRIRPSSAGKAEDPRFTVCPAACDERTPSPEVSPSAKRCA